MPLRRTRLPDDVREQLGIPRRGRVLASGRLTDGWAAATLPALHVAREGAEPLRREWYLVDGARLDVESATLTVTWVDGLPPTDLPLAEDAGVALPRAVHNLVQRSVVHREVVTLPSGVPVRVALRRTADGELLTQVIGTGEVDLTDPATAAVVDAAEARVREAAGLR
jgi:hypothetical protein